MNGGKVMLAIFAVLMALGLLVKSCERDPAKNAKPYYYRDHSVHQEARLPWP